MRGWHGSCCISFLLGADMICIKGDKLKNAKTPINIGSSKDYKQS